jgi:hypothetical protein
MNIETLESDNSVKAKPQTQFNRKKSLILNQILDINRSKSVLVPLPDPNQNQNNERK